MRFSAGFRWSLMLCLALMSTACTRQQAASIVFAVATAPSVLDPRLAGDAASERVNALLFDRLVEIDESGMPQPGMATWEHVDPRRYRFLLNPERRPFWDGRMPNADDVAATYRSLLQPAFGSPHAGTLSGIERIDVIADDVVEFHLQREDPRFPTRLGIGIVPADRATAVDFSRQPMGSGSFSFSGWRDDGGLLIVRRRDDRAIALVPVPDPTMRVLKLLRGEAQLLQNDLPAELYRYLAASPGIEMTESDGTTFAYLGFNLEDPVTGRHEVRAAIAHAIDRDAIVEHLFGGWARPAESILQPQHWAGLPRPASYDYDPARARELLRRAGFGPDRRLVISYKTSSDPFRLRIASVFQQQLARVGIDLKIASHDWGTFFGDIKAGRFQMYSLAWVGVNSPDILRYAFHSRSLPPEGANRGRYVDPEVDTMIDLAEQSPTADAIELYRRIQRRIHRDLVYVPLWYESNVVASSGVRGYRPGYDGNYLALEYMDANNAAD
jgi:peptide/nickel transport system substrate-binding protein